MMCFCLAYKHACANFRLPHRSQQSSIPSDCMQGLGRISVVRVAKTGQLLVMPKQVLAQEACSLLWSLVDLNPRVLSLFVGSNVEDPSQPSALQSGMWAAVLVRRTVAFHSLDIAHEPQRGIFILQVIVCCATSKNTYGSLRYLHAT